MVCCVPAPDALKIRGLANLLPAESVAVLEGVGYDSRTAQAHWYHPSLKGRLRRLFAEAGYQDQDRDQDQDQDYYYKYKQIF